MKEPSHTKVFCLGLSRTGTTSLSCALNCLGIKTLHYSLSAYVQIEEISDRHRYNPTVHKSKYWNWTLHREIKSQKRKCIKDILSEYQGFADLPFPFLYEEMSNRFPDAKFIYTYREEENWLNSMKWMIEDGPVIWKQGLLDEDIRAWAYGTTSYEPNQLKETYRSHDNAVRKYFHNSNNLLILNIDRGGIPYPMLSEFLGLEMTKHSPSIENKRRAPKTFAKVIHKTKRKFIPIHATAAFISKIKRSI